MLCLSPYGTTKVVECLSEDYDIELLERVSFVQQNLQVAMISCDLFHYLS